MTDPTDTSETANGELRSSLPLAGECVAFTGTLASMVHREAAERAAECGGRPVRSVSRSVTMLVVGEEGWPLEEDGEPSQKLKLASQLAGEGYDIRIISESDWLHLIGLNERRDEIQRFHTPSMLSRLLEIPIGIIRRWARIGLIHAVRRVGRMPYFDFREVASARRLAQLLDEGVRPATLERSLAELSRTLAGTDRSLAQLRLLVQDENVVLRDAHGVLIPRTGQRLLDFDSPSDLRLHVQDDANETTRSDIDAEEDEEHEEDMPVAISFAEARMKLEDRGMDEWTADEWFNEGCRLAEESAFEASVNAFRNCLSLLASDRAMLLDPACTSAAQPEMYPDPADVHFHLADVLYRSGQTEAAIERYYCAIEFAPDFIEAWTQLGCLQTERGCWLMAEEALLTAIAIHDANPDALLHYAQLLDQTNRTEDSLVYWEKYLQLDSRGPWADHARRRLEEAAQPVGGPRE